MTTLAAVNITPTNATLNALVNPNGADTDVYFQWGATTNYGNYTATNTLTASLNTRASGGPGHWRFAAHSTNHFRAVAVNSAGTTYGADLTLITPPLPPPAITQVANHSIVGGQAVVITNRAQVGHPAGHLQPGQLRARRAPSITTNGVFTWTPILRSRQLHQSDHHLGHRQRQLRP